MTTGFGLIIWKDKADRGWRVDKELVQRHVMSEMPRRSLHGDIEQTIGAMGVETGEGS